MRDLTQEEIVLLLTDIKNETSQYSIDEVISMIKNGVEGERHGEEAYLDLCRTILKDGTVKKDRTGTGTISIFGYQMRFNLQKGLPVLTSKKVLIKKIVEELFWFIKGDTNIKYLVERDNHIWDDWCIESYFESDDYTGTVDMKNFGIRKQTDPEFAKVFEKERAIFCERLLTEPGFSDKYGSIGEGAYGAQWRNFGGGEDGVDQLKDAIEQIKNNPDSRRLIISAWSPKLVRDGKVLLPPCHTLFQFYVENGKLSCQLYQRSGDVFLGVPFNIVSYSILTHLIAHECNLEVGDFVHTLGDAHIYLNHVDQVKLQLSRGPKAPFPTLHLNQEKTSIFDFNEEDISISGYDSHPFIKGIVAV